MRFAAVVFLALLLLPARAYAGPLEDAQAAYDRRDYPTALKLLQPLAEQGNPVAQYSLGQMFNAGQGVPINNYKAEDWYMKSAEQGFAPAQYNIGEMHYRSLNGKVADTEALSWFRKAAAQGYSRAESRVGDCYLEGRGTPKNRAEALNWFSKAARQGDERAEYSLGLMNYFNENYEEASFWLSLSPNGIYPDQPSICDRNLKRGAYLDYFGCQAIGYALPVFVDIHYAVTGNDRFLSWKDKAYSHLTAKQIADVHNRLTEWKPTPAPMKAQNQPTLP